jgi:hypothetical protein
MERRTFSVAFLASVAAVASQPQRSEAAPDLFKANPLTNSALEKIRIWNQDEADNIVYGGELASGSDNKITALDQYVQLLLPILTVERELSAVDRLLNAGKPATKEEYAALFERLQTILAQSLFDRVNFKKAFNAFADNIYYSDPDRANLYLGGGAIPKTTQSIAYLVRNDVLTSVEDLRAEVEYLSKETAKYGDGDAVRAGEGGLDLEELFRLSKTANGGMAKYVDLVPPKELEAGREKFSQ